MDLSSINPREFFEKYLSLTHLSGDEYRALCPFHSDKKDPNLSINIKKGLYKCFACDAKGNIVDFYKQHTGKTARQFAEEFTIPNIDKEQVYFYQKALMREPSHLKYLKSIRGLSDDTIKKFKIGWDGYRITIPIYDEYGLLVNIRRYLSDDKNKMISYKKGYGRVALYGAKNLKSDFILCAGEWDRIISEQNGFNTITITGGEGSWNDKWNVEGKEIAIIFDCDNAGKNAANKIADKLAGNNKIKIIDLKLKDKEDLSDWFVKYKYTATQLKEIINNTEYHKKRTKRYIKTVLSDASQSRFFNQNIRFKSVVAGKNLSPYQIPSIIELQCDKPGTQPKCALCALNPKGYKKITIKNNEDILDLVDISKQQLIGIIKKKINLPKCGSYYILREEKRNIEELKLIPEIEFHDNSEYVIRKAYSLSDNIKTNQTYNFFGTTLPDPKNQQAIHLLEKAESAKDNIDEFKLTDTVKEQLKVFQLNGLSIAEKLKEIYNDFSFNVTHIYHREDLLLALDLVWHSVLSFKFLDKTITKGWTELFVIGDSRTGKSETVKTLLHHYKCGERISAENTTTAGLVAGLQQSNKTWTLMWGKIPLNDRRLLVIDEAGQMTHEDFSVLSDIRSSGIAEIIKVHTQKTKARTRLVFIANPPKRRLIEYNYGVMGLKEIIGQNEDIARFDFVLSVSDVDVPHTEINKRHDEKISHKYTSDLCHNLIMFIWSRGINDVIYEENTEDRILEVSKEFASTFTNVIPIVQGAEIRIKLSKLSVALAARLYSVDETGEKIKVTVDHVNYIRTFLLKIYNKQGLDYYVFSQQRKKDSTLGTDNGYIKEVLKDDLRLVEMLLDNIYYSISDVENFFSVDRKEAKNIINNFLKFRAMKKYSTNYIKTTAFIGFLKTFQKELEKNKIQEEI